MCANKEPPPIDLQDLDSILAEFQGQRWALIPLLQRVQDHFGYIPPETIEPVARELGLFPTQVQGVINFYAQFYTSPRGRNIIRVCRGTACHVRGSGTILKIVKQNLGVEDGETTPDYNFTLETVACLGACALAPVIVGNQQYYGRMNPKKIENLMDFFTTETP
jgi:NADH-quinone oxidoreductase E subunit